MPLFSQKTIIVERFFSQTGKLKIRQIGPSKNNLNHTIKAEPVTAGVDATLYVWILCTDSIISGPETRYIKLLRP